MKPLNEAQTEAYNQILIQMMGHRVTLLHGVTSSGKTEIYIHLIQKAINEKKQVLYLLPEIALTIQITERLKAVFGDQLGIYHSKYSDAERVEIWQKQLSDNPYSVILGARSAIFLPFHRLGLILSTKNTTKVTSNRTLLHVIMLARPLLSWDRCILRRKRS